MVGSILKIDAKKVYSLEAKYFYRLSHPAKVKRQVNKELIEQFSS